MEYIHFLILMVGCTIGCVWSAMIMLFSFCISNNQIKKIEYEKQEEEEFSKKLKKVNAEIYNLVKKRIKK